MAASEVATASSRPEESSRRGSSRGGSTPATTATTPISVVRGTANAWPLTRGLWALRASVASSTRGVSSTEVAAAPVTSGASSSYRGTNTVTASNGSWSRTVTAIRLPSVVGVEAGAEGAREVDQVAQQPLGVAVGRERVGRPLQLRVHVAGDQARARCPSAPR